MICAERRLTTEQTGAGMRYLECFTLEETVRVGSHMGQFTKTRQRRRNKALMKQEFTQVTTVCG
jgi:hypothetical protein